MYGGAPKCHICTKSAFPFESVNYSGRAYHEQCFKCKICNTRISSVTDVAEYDAEVFHKTCFLKTFKESGGKYAGRAVSGNRNSLVNNSSRTRAPPPPPPPGSASSADAASPQPSPQPSPQISPHPSPTFTSLNENAPFGDRRGGIALLIIDPQIDFHKGGSLAVAGADDDAVRIAALIDESKDRISQICVTLDSHLKLHIANPFFWENEQKHHPPPFTQITEQDIRSKKWTPTRPSLLQHALSYTQALAEGKKYTLMVWPEHCLIGTAGHNVVEPINGALQRWSGHNLDMVHYVNKGSCPLVEMYSGLKADMEMPRIKATQLNRDLIARLLQADRVLICGQAMSHCVRATLTDLLDNWPRERLRDVVLLKDACSSVTGFEASGEALIQDVVQRGGRVCRISEALSA